MKYLSLDENYTHGALSKDTNNFGGMSGRWQGTMKHSYTTMHSLEDPSKFVWLQWGHNQSSNTSTSFNLIESTVEKMQDKSTYINAGWDFNTIWEMDPDTGYPRLQWEKNIK